MSGNKNTECKIVGKSSCANKIMPDLNTHKMKIRIAKLKRSGQFVSILLALLVVYHTTTPSPVNAEAVIFYFKHDYGPTDRVPIVNRTVNFTPICDGSRSNPPLSGPRLPGLDFARKYAGGRSCPQTTDNNRFDSQLNWVFLIDDTQRLSDYLKNHLRQQNLLRQVNGDEVIAPGVRNFREDGNYQGMNVLVVGETAFRQVNSNPENWFNTLNSLVLNAPATPVRTMSPYMTQCAAEDVPLPPAWRTDRRVNTASGWQYRGHILRNLILDDNPRLPDADVWTYITQNGICIALPRKTDAGRILSLGIICQSRQTGKACFWDNRRKRRDRLGGAGTRIVDEALDGMEPSDMQDGSDVAENCTRCHRGDNVFLLIPHTTLAVPQSTTTGTRSTRNGLPVLETDLAPSLRYEPIPTGRTSAVPGRRALRWSNPAPSKRKGSSPCSRCHEIPALTADYCNTLIKPMIEKRLMPPRLNPSDSLLSLRGGYSNDVREIVRACQRRHRVEINIP